MKLAQYIQLMRLHKPIGIFLLLWPTWWALWLAAHGMPSIKNAVIFTLGVILMRTAGCVINDIADRHFDRHVTRTRMRPITTGEISVRAALILFFALCVMAFVLVLFTNRLTLILSFFALLTAMVYPFSKRFTHWPQLILGIAFSFSIPMATAAQINHVPLSAVLLMLANIVWTMAYDTEYAMTDRDEDVKIGVKSTAILWGHCDRLFIALLQSAFLLLLAVIGKIEALSLAYFSSIFLAALLFIYQQKLITQREPKQCFAAFLNNHWVGLIVFVGVVLA